MSLQGHFSLFNAASQGTACFISQIHNNKNGLLSQGCCCFLSPAKSAGSLQGKVVGKHTSSHAMLQAGTHFPLPHASAQQAYSSATQESACSSPHSLPPSIRYMLWIDVWATACPPHAYLKSHAAGSPHKQVTRQNTLFLSH